MTTVQEAEAALSAPAVPAADAHVDPADVLEQIITAHRAALLALAPRQEQRSARVEAGWHITELGLLLRVRDGQTQSTARGTGNRGRHGESTGADRPSH